MDEPTEFDVLRAEYEQLRQDERQYLAANVAQVAVLVTLVAAFVAAFVVSDKPRDEIHDVIYLFAPLVPLGVFSFIEAQAVAISVRSAYMRAIEARLYAIRPIQVDDWRVPSYAHWLFDLWVRGRARFLWWIAGTAALAMFFATILMPIWAAGRSWLQLVMVIAYVPTSVYVAGMYVLAAWGSGSWFTGRVNRTDVARNGPY